MKNYLVIIAMAAAVAAAALTGCGRGDVAEVNGKKISQEEFEKYMRPRAGAQLLTQMINDRLTLDLAKQKGVEPTDEQVNQRLALMRKSIDLDEQMKQAGLTVNDAKDQLRVQQAMANLAWQVNKDKIQADAVKRAYEMQKPALYDIPERVRVEFVAFGTPAAAQKAAKKLKEGSTLKEVVDEPGGDHGNIERQTVRKSGPGVTPDLAKAAFGTPKGQTSKPFKYTINRPGQQPRDNWIILKPGDRLPAVKISLADAKPVLERDLAFEMAKGDRDFQDMVREARRQAKVKVLDPLFKSVQEVF